MRPCCGIAPTVIKRDGKSYCSECDSGQPSIGDNIDFSKLYGELEDWKLTSSPISNGKCECGSEKVGSNKHSDYCPKYEKLVPSKNE